MMKFPNVNNDSFFLTSRFFYFISEIKGKMKYRLQYSTRYAIPLVMCLELLQLLDHINLLLVMQTFCYIFLKIVFR